MPKLEIKPEMIDVTRGGLFGPADPERVFIPGIDRYYIDDVEVTHDEFRKALAATS